MQSVEQISIILNTYGAWAIVSLCIIALVALWTIKERTTAEKDQEIREIRTEKEKELAALNERIIKMTERQTEMLTENKIVNQNIEKLLNRFLETWYKQNI